MATFATFAGVHLKDINTGAPIPGNDATQTIVKRAADPGKGREIKEWEALGAYVTKVAGANTDALGPGHLPLRYKKGDPAGALPRRSTCVGAHATSGICAN
jgi:hypothetical protein